MPPFRLYLITDRRRSYHDSAQLLPLLANAGLCAVQVREKDLSPAALYAHCRGIDQALGEQPNSPLASGAVLQRFLNDRADMALNLGWQGVHLRQESAPLQKWQPVLRTRLSVGVSTHTLAEVLEAETAAADFATFGPIFPTASKRGLSQLPGLKALEEAALRTRLPLFALGGITPERVRACLDAGACGVAAITALWQAEEPLRVLEDFAHALGRL